MRIIRVAVFGLGAGMVACGGGESSSPGTANGPPQAPVRVTPDWFKGSSNCFSNLLADARSCLAAGVKGVLSADRKACDYGNGTVTEVVSPIPTRGLDNYVWDLTVTKSGGMCVHVKESGPQSTTNGGIDTYETPLGSVTFGLSGKTDFSMTCPDGSSVLIDTQSFLQGAVGYLPGITSSLSLTEIKASLSGDPAGGDAMLIDCPLPP